MAAYVIGAVFLVVGFAVLLSVVYSCVYGLKSTEWPETSGNIVLSAVESKPGTDGGSFYRPRIEYTYTVGGARFVGNRLFFGDWIELPVAFMAQRYSLRYRPGGPVTVRYNPRKPASAVLEAGFRWINVWGCAGGIVFIAFGILTLGR